MTATTIPDARNHPVNTSSQAFATEILFNDPTGGDLKVTMVANVTGFAPGRVVDIYMTFQLLVDTDENGNQSNARLSLTTVDVQGPMIQFIAFYRPGYAAGYY